MNKLQQREAAMRRTTAWMPVRFERGGRDRLETLHPAYFALVMATGIVALAAKIHGLAGIARILFWLNAFFFPVLVLVTLARMGRHPAEFLNDLRSHSRGVGFFTVVAATGVFGSQLVLQMAAAPVALIFWYAAVVLWCVVTYGVLAVLTVKAEKPGLAEGLNGGWLVVVVATQSVSILTVQLVGAGAFSGGEQALLFSALVLWLGGGALYLWLMTLIFFRYTFYPMSPADLTPPYWINMGAVAISTLAGATLLGANGISPVIRELAPFVKGFTLFYWAIGTWWIPMLIVLGVWRYVLRRVPFAYDPLYWGGVFPLGMYCVCTFRLSEALQLPFLEPVSELFLFVAIAAWTLTFIGLLDSLRGSSRPKGFDPQEASR